ncbi:phage tail protein [Klebsiella pneumoniae]
MATKYFALLTNIGAAKLANATALGAQVEITQMAVGDGNGALPIPNPAQTALVHEQRRKPLNSLNIDQNNTSQIIAEQVIPENEGGWWIREIGLFDKDGDMIAVANCAETYKPQLQEGSGRVQVVRMILIVSSTEAITLKIDPSVVLATRQYVDEKVIEVKTYADGLMKKHVDAANPHKQYPLIENALKEMADSGLIDKLFENLGLGNAAKKNVGSGNGQVPDMSFFQSTKGSNGIQYLPSGIIVQWGIWNLSVVGDYNSETVGGVTWYTHYIKPLYTVAFPNMALVNFMNLAGSTFEGQTNEFNTFIRSNMSAASDGKAGSRTNACVSVTSRILGYTPTVHWLAIGY